MRLGFRFKCNWTFLLKNTTHHVITYSVSLQVFLQLEILSEQRRKSKLCPTCFIKLNQNFYDSAEVYNWHDGNNNNLRTIEAQIMQKLKNNEARPKFTGSCRKMRVVDKTVNCCFYIANCPWRKITQTNIHTWKNLTKKVKEVKNPEEERTRRVSKL